jgi:hypothetical protein
MRLGEEVEVLAPSALRAEITRRLRAMLGHYQTPSSVRGARGLKVSGHPQPRTKKVRGK